MLIKLFRLARYNGPNPINANESCWLHAVISERQ